MGIAAKAPRGGLAEQLAGSSRPLILRNAEIERFEDQHRGIFDVWDGFFGRSTKPTSREVRDMVALGLVGGGMADVAADTLLAGLGPDENLFLYQIAQALLGVAFMPDSVEGGGDELDASPEDDPEKKTDPALGA
ncbi:gene transfer agent family protein [Rhodobacteraceae bacterium R_SAG7]|nr:gene transfer agent family protein [Rhodobacteraceae bacterium R_SAG7]